MQRPEPFAHCEITPADLGRSTRRPQRDRPRRRGPPQSSRLRPCTPHTRPGRRSLGRAKTDEQKDVTVPSHQIQELGRPKLATGTPILEGPEAENPPMTLVDTVQRPLAGISERRILSEEADS